MDWRKNRFVRPILENNHGKLKAFVVSRIIPANYFVAGWITRAVL